MQVPTVAPVETGFGDAVERLGVRASSIAIAFGAVLFVLPVPGTFVTGSPVLLAGAVARYLGS